MTKTSYEKFEQSSKKNRLLLRAEEMMLELQEEILVVLDRRGVSRQEVSDTIRKVLSGGVPLTMSLLASVADELGCRVRLHFEDIHLRSLTHEKIGIR